MTFLLVAVRKVAAGHKMVAQGHAAVAEGWQLFEEAVEEAGPSDLPNLVCQLKEKMTQPRCHHPHIKLQWKLGTRQLCHPLLHRSK